ncbi:unnamed protein product, partial [Vitis vinifera]
MNFKIVTAIYVILYLPIFLLLSKLLCNCDYLCDYWVFTRFFFFFFCGIENKKKKLTFHKNREVEGDEARLREGRVLEAREIIS